MEEKAVFNAMRLENRWLGELPATRFFFRTCILYLIELPHAGTLHQALAKPVLRCC